MAVLGAVPPPVFYKQPAVFKNAPRKAPKEVFFRGAVFGGGFRGAVLEATKRPKTNTTKNCSPKTALM